MVKKKKEGKDVKKKGTKKKGKKTKSNSDKQLNIVVGVMVGLIVFLVLIAIIANAANNFGYLGLDFKKVKEGDLMFYTTDFEISTSVGNKISGGMYFRNDPRTLRDIPIDGSIVLSSWYDTYVSTNPNIDGCDDNMIALTNMGVFLKMVGANAMSASIDEEFAAEKDIPYITCENADAEDTVIIVQKAEENSINQLSNRCYEINFKDCEILESTERFILGSIAGAMGNYNI